MKIENSQRAQILTEALPYIQNYNGKVIVVKYGGSSMLTEELKESVMGDIILLSLIGVRVVLVHGGGPEITQVLEKMGMKSEFKDGLRVTDKETAEVVQMVLAGKISKSLVGLIQTLGGKAMGLTGMDGGFLESKALSPELGYVGEIIKVNSQPILDTLDMGYIPVISTLGYDNDGNCYNINADSAASKIAGSLGAECLISMTDTPGILEKQDDPNSLISEIQVSEAPQYIKNGSITGGMIPKVQCCIDCIRQGVRKAFILDGRIPHSILIETLTDEGLGTMLY